MKVDKRGYAYLGKKFANSEFVVEEVEDSNVLILEKVVKVPAKDVWFYSQAWQKGERKAQADIDSGKVKSAKNIERYFKGIRKIRLNKRKSLKWVSFSNKNLKF